MRLDEALSVSREALNELLEKTADAILVVDGKGVVRWANSAAQSLLGRGFDDGIIGKSFGFPLVSGSNTEIDLLDAAGTPVAAEMRVVTTKLEDGETVSLAILRDLTERRRLYQERLERERLEAERAQIAAERDRLEVLARATKALDETLLLDVAVSNFLKVLTDDVADAAGLIIEPRDIDRREWFLSDGSVDDTVWELVKEGLHDGSEWLHDEGKSPSFRDHLEFSSTPVLPLFVDKRQAGVLAVLCRSRPVRGNDLRLLLSLRDSLQAALERSEVHRRMAEESALRDRFFAKVSHEIRNAVQALSGWSQLLRDLLSPEGDAADGFSAIENNALLLQRLADDMMEVSEMLSGRISIRTAIVDLPRTLREASAAMQPAAEEAGVELHYEGTDSALVEGDETRLHQVFHNLIGNAIRYTPDGGRVDITTERDEFGVRALIRDSGVGIESDEAEALFGAFQQGKAGRGKRGGLGLGLTIAREIVNLHNGELSFSSEGKDKGTTFIVELPLARFTETDSASDSAT